MLKRDFNVNYNRDYAMDHYMKLRKFANDTDIDANNLMDIGDNSILIFTILETIGYELLGSVYRYKPQMEMIFQRNFQIYEARKTLLESGYLVGIHVTMESEIAIILNSILPKIFKIIEPFPYDRIAIMMDWSDLRYCYELLYPNGDFMKLFEQSFSLTNRDKLLALTQMETFSNPQI